MLNWFKKYQKQRAAYKTYQTLNSLSERQLRDIGLSRDQIFSVAERIKEKG